MPISLSSESEKNFFFLNHHGQWFPTRGHINPPRGHLIMSGDNFELSVLERDVTGIQWVEVGVAAPMARNIQPEMSNMNQPY